MHHRRAPRVREGKHSCCGLISPSMRMGVDHLKAAGETSWWHKLALASRNTHSPACQLVDACTYTSWSLCNPGYSLAFLLSFFYCFQILWQHWRACLSRHSPTAEEQGWECGVHLLPVVCMLQMGMWLSSQECGHLCACPHIRLPEPLHTSSGRA